MDTKASSQDVPEDLESLYDRLDALWTQHLALLDAYHSAQEQIQKELASGFFSLAQANFKSSLNRRFGQDHYDQRSTASTRASIGTAEANSGPRFQIRKLEVEKAQASSVTTDSRSSKHGPDTTAAASAKAETDEKLESDAPAQLPTPDATPEPPDMSAPTGGKRNSQAPGEEASSTGANDSSQATSRPLQDPIRQFGILVPFSLRTAQRAFAVVVQGEDTVVRAANAARGMREIEGEIRRVRKVVRKMERSG